MPSVSPPRTSNDTLSTALKEPNVFVTASTTRRRLSGEVVMRCTTVLSGCRNAEPLIAARFVAAELKRSGAN